MVRNKLYLYKGKRYLLQGGDVILIEKDKTPAWVNWSVGFILQVGKCIGHNVKLKGFNGISDR